MSERTVTQLVAAPPIETLRVEVVEGPDSGKSCQAKSEALTIGTADVNDLVLTDPTVSRFHLELTKSADGIILVDHGSRNGTLIGHARIKGAIIVPGTTLKLGNTSLRVLDGEKVTVEVADQDVLGGLYGRAAKMRRLMAQIERAAKSETSVLIVGESGTGKELIARALHDLGPRSGKPIETVDCGTLSPTLVASELFGHERGAFTGADQQHQGAFERARGGTLFLDEIGELPQALQANLLGALERKRFKRVGGKEEIASDVRVVAATNRDLREEVNAGTFRLDLYYRIAVVTLKVPPLRERPEDIPILVEHFLRECGFEEPMHELIGEKAMKSLLQHRWPGNVRELRNMVEATVTMGETPELDGVLAPPSGDQAGDDLWAPLLSLSYKEARGQLLQSFEERYLKSLLERSGDNLAKAARLAKMDRTYLNTLIKKHGLR